MSRRSITLVITGSIAAVKAYDLIQILNAGGIAVSVILTDAAQQWITRKAARMVTDQEVLTLADITAQPGRLHQLLGKSDAILVAPASADFIRQLRFSDSTLAKALHKSGKPLAVAPAMNIMMWQHPATQRNSRALLENGVYFLGPVDGNMACGDVGYGRFMEPAIIAQSVPALLSRAPHPAFLEINRALLASPALPALSNALALKPHKKLLLVIQEGKDICASYALISRLRALGWNVTCAASEEAAEMLPAEGLATLSTQPAYTRHYQDDVQGMEHIRLPEQADIVMIAPAGARSVSDMLQGSARDFTGCLYLASKKPVVLVPSCDPSRQPSDMDLERLKRDGVCILAIPPQFDMAGKERAGAIADALESLAVSSAEAKSHAS